MVHKALHSLEVRIIVKEKVLEVATERQGDNNYNTEAAAEVSGCLRDLWELNTQGG